MLEFLIAMVQEKSSALQDVHVFVVDDDVDTLEVFTSILKSYGATVTSATSLKEAFTVIQTQQPDILISNLKMSDQSGINSITELRNNDLPQVRSIPAIAVTSYTTALSLEELKELETAGFQTFLSRPINSDDLLQTILRLTQQQSP